MPLKKLIVISVPTIENDQRGGVEELDAGELSTGEPRCGEAVCGPVSTTYIIPNLTNTFK